MKLTTEEQARLADTAPALLKACEDWVEWFVDCADLFDGLATDPGAGPLITRMQAAIYKVRGENAERPATEAVSRPPETIGVEENTDSVAQPGAADKRESGEDTL